MTESPHIPRPREAFLPGIPIWLRIILATTGFATFALGTLAVFVTENGPGSAALVAGGTALVVLGVLADRLEGIEIAGIKLLTRAAQATNLAVNKEEAARIAEAQGDDQIASALRDEAEELRRQAITAGAAYEGLRSRMGSGWDRTARIEALLEETVITAPSASSETVGEIFETGADGVRMFALKLMERQPESAHAPSIVDAILKSHSATEQWHGLQAANRALDFRLPPGEHASIVDAVGLALRTGMITPSDHDRYRAAKTILERYGA